MSLTASRPALAGIAVALVSLGAILASDGWRTALLAALVLGGVLLTRVRFAPHAAVVLAAVMAFVALTGHAPQSSDRPGQPDRPRPAQR